MIKSDCVKEYVMNDMALKIDLPSFLHEIATATKNTAYPVCFNILNKVLSILAQRAIELDDPALHIIMLNLSLYEDSHNEDINDIREKLS